MKHLRNLEWEEVFLEWHKNEGQKPDWLALAKERGYESWADWRIRGYARRFECEKAEWSLVEIENPSEVVATWYGGPFRTWIERWYGGEVTKTFAEIVTHPDIVAHAGIRERAAHYRSGNVITALQLTDGRIIVIEGMHRSCALALMAAEGRPYQGPLTFAIGKSALAELPPVGKNG